MSFAVDIYRRRQPAVRETALTNATQDLIRRSECGSNGEGDSNASTREGLIYVFPVSLKRVRAGSSKVWALQAWERTERATRQHNAR